MEITGNQITEFRKANGLTQSELAKQLGVSVRTIQNYECGGKIPSTKLETFENLLNSDKKGKEIKMIRMDDHMERKFDGISKNEIALYIIHYKDEFMENNLFTLFIDKISHERALQIIKEM